MKTFVQKQVLEDTIAFLEKQIASLEESAMFGEDYDLGLAHLYMSGLRKKTMLDLRKLTAKEFA